MSFTKLNGASFSDGQERARDVLMSARNVCLYGGTRSGKTFLIVRGIIHRALRGDNSRHALLRFRANAAWQSLALDTIPKVVRTCFPGLVLNEHAQLKYFTTPNGSELWIGGLDDKERLDKILGTEYSTLYLNEASQISYEAYLQASTRLAQACEGVTQRCFVDLNPVGRNHWTYKLFVKKVDPKSGQPLHDPENYSVGRLNPVDNAHNLSAEYIASLANMPERQRKRFYEGSFVEEVDGALWTYELLEKCRCSDSDISEEKRSRVVVAVDPSGASSKEDEKSDDIGIVVAAKGIDDKAYILEDASLLAGPRDWAAMAVKMYKKYNADSIVAEKNFGGEMVRTTIQAVDPYANVKLVTASRGKAVRAEPISALYEQGNVYHLGRFDKLEEQLCSFTSGGYQGPNSPDNADAAIWALTELMLEEDVPYAQTGEYRHKFW